jgi:hypothetical protein
MTEGKSTEARGSLTAGDGGPAGGEPVAGEEQNPVLWAISAISCGQPGRTGKAGRE